MNRWGGKNRPMTWTEERTRKLYEMAKAGATVDEVLEAFKDMKPDRVKYKLMMLGFGYSGGKIHVSRRIS